MRLHLQKVDEINWSNAGSSDRVDIILLVSIDYPGVERIKSPVGEMRVDWRTWSNLSGGKEEITLEVQ